MREQSSQVCVCVRGGGGVYGGRVLSIKVFQIHVHP